MVTVLCGFVIAAALLSVLAFGGNVALSLLAAATAAGVAVFDWLLGRRKAWARVLAAVLGLALLGFCFYIPSAVSDYGYSDYLGMTEDYGNALLRRDEGAGEAAEALRAEIVDKYGDSDDLRYLEAVAALSKGELGEAERRVNSFEDKHSTVYYLLREDLLVYGDYDESARQDRLRELYLQAAADNPGWVYALQRAGGMLFDQGKYAQAAYYLTNALACAEIADPETLYFLGAALMEQGEYQKGAYYFQQAVDAGADEALLSGIAWYAKKAGIEVRDS